MDPGLLLPSTDLLLAFLIAGIALNLTPGPDMTFVALCGARGGRRAGLAAAAGIYVGCLGHIAFSVLGLAALLAASQTAFAIVKWIGVAYLAYLALQLLRSPREPRPDAGPRSACAPLHAFRQAAVVNLLNPKVGIFFLAFLPQFIEPAAAMPWLQILTLGIVFNTTGIIVNGCVGVFSAAVAMRIGSVERLTTCARWMAAGVLGGLAAKLALSNR